VTKVSYQGKTLLDDQVLTVALNNYRAVGGGEYNAYKQAEVIQDTGLTIQDLMIAYLEKTGQLAVDEPLDFNINY
jgi:2',3'-cyclic-nucleotide 2'-phosphodiesterase/3'-nucleotidase